MGKPTGFREFPRADAEERPVSVRLNDYREVDESVPLHKLKTQGARCMDCGIPFCHTGCPVGNLIPDWNDHTYKGDLKRAFEALTSTNNFPEFTGRVCPAPCEEACVLNINDDPVSIKLIEKTIADEAFKAGLLQPRPPKTRTGKIIAIVGSGPAGLACADQLNKAGHRVTVFEKSDKIGGLLRYGIPDFKLEKWVVDRRVGLMREEGVIFETGINVGVNFPADKLKSFDAVILAGGAGLARELPIPGRELHGIYPAMTFLPQQNRRLAGLQAVPEGEDEITAEGKHVIVIGGGDTGSDCVGTSNRQGARSVTQFELLPKPPDGRPDNQPWPYWPMKLRTSSSHEEGVERQWNILTKSFSGRNGKVEKLVTVAVEWVKPAGGGAPQLKEVAGTERAWEADLVLLAMGFLGPETKGMVETLGLGLDARGNVKTDENYQTTVPTIFSAGDMRRGQSLVVWAISEGREAARCVDRFLMGETRLPTKDDVDLPRV